MATQSKSVKQLSIRQDQSDAADQSIKSNKEEGSSKITVAIGVGAVALGVVAYGAGLKLANAEPTAAQVSPDGLSAAWTAITAVSLGISATLVGTSMLAYEGIRWLAGKVGAFMQNQFRDF